MELLQILFFAGLAVFLGVRLYTTLGKPTGRSPEEHAREERERQSAREAAAPAASAQDRSEAGRSDSARPQTVAATVEGPAAEGLNAIAQADPGFDPAGFVKGARAAYEMIVTAYAQGDVAALRPLLTEKVHAGYAESIARRQEKGETLTTEVERIVKSDIAEASLNDDRAKVRVAFTAELATETKNADGQPIAGDLNTLKTVSEIWSFERDVTDADPNWRLAGVKPA